MQYKEPNKKELKQQAKKFAKNRTLAQKNKNNLAAAKFQPEEDNITFKTPEMTPEQKKENLQIFGGEVKRIKGLTPAYAIHPGEILKDELKARKIKQKDFANMIGIEPSQLNEILQGKRHFTTGLALLTEAALQIDAQIWVNLRNNYELDTLKQDKDFQEHLDGVRKSCVRAKGGDD